MFCLKDLCVLKTIWKVKQEIWEKICARLKHKQKLKMKGTFAFKFTRKGKKLLIWCTKLFISATRKQTFWDLTARRKFSNSRVMKRNSRLKEGFHSTSQMIHWSRTHSNEIIKFKALLICELCKHKFQCFMSDGVDLISILAKYYFLPFDCNEGRFWLQSVGEDLISTDESKQ